MENVTTMENSDQGSQNRCFHEWMNLQEEELLELRQALDLNPDPAEHTTDLRQLVEKNIMHFQEYAVQRGRLARDDISPYFSPNWCTSLEGSMLWAGGCRPSIFIRLVYAFSGKEIASHLDEYLQGRGTGGLGKLSASQIGSINSLQLKTVGEEDKLSTKLASLQEEIADQPIASIVQELHSHTAPSEEAEEALNNHAVCMTRVLEEADNLRLNTLKELISILTPVQAVEFLAAGKKLHLCIHAWGRRRDHEHGRH